MNRRLITISGEQGIGKTELAKLISLGLKSVEINSSTNPSEYYDAECIIVEEVSTKRELQFLKDISCKQTLTFRRLYKRNSETVKFEPKIIIGIFQDKQVIDNTVNRIFFHYKLSS